MMNKKNCTDPKNSKRVKKNSDKISANSKERRKNYFIIGNKKIL